MENSEIIKNIFLNLFDDVYFNFLIKNKIYETVFLTEFFKSNKNISKGNFYDFDNRKLNNSKTSIKGILEIIKQNRQFAG